MKKALLLFSAALIAGFSAKAGVDPATYAPVNDIKCVNVWDNSRVVNADAYAAEPVANTLSRMAVMSNGVIYVGCSAADDPEVTETTTDGKVVPVNCGTIYKYDAATGKFLGKLKLTLDGKRITGTLCANNVGVDNYGNLWVAPYTDVKKMDIPVYSVDKESGALTLQATLTKDAEARVDYIDVAGDITRAQNMVSVIGAGAATNFVFGWTAPKGGDWTGFFDGDIHLAISAMFPADQTAWGVAPYAKIVIGADELAYAGDLFYVDGFTTAPALYNRAGEIQSDFSTINKDSGMLPAMGPNGVAEFALEGRNFIAYPMVQYDKDPGCLINVCELGEGQVIAGMTKYWTLPEAGLGTTSDSGTRIHCINREYAKDADGHDYVNLLTFKCYNGMALYQIGKYVGTGIKDAVAGNAVSVVAANGVITLSAQASQIALYNVAGQLVAKVNNASQIAAPQAGAYIVKAVVDGASVVKKVVL